MVKSKMKSAIFLRKSDGNFVLVENLKPDIDGEVEWWYVKEVCTGQILQCHANDLYTHAIPQFLKESEK